MEEKIKTKSDLELANKINEMNDEFAISKLEKDLKMDEDKDKQEKLNRLKNIKNLKEEVQKKIINKKNLNELEEEKMKNIDYNGLKEKKKITNFYTTVIDQIKK